MKSITEIIITAFAAALIMAMPAYADGPHAKGIKLDGTVGNAGALDLPGPDYDIRAEYGHQAGANLFHSFQQFSIHQGESATFTGPDSVQNIISRVTGGSASWIDGRLGSSIPGADLYLLNTAGLMFGPNASLDLSGSFRVSTADYLRLGENDRFYSTPHANDVLSVAAPAAFGFLDNNIAKISFEGKGEIRAESWDGQPAGLSVARGKTISVVGGEIEMNKGTCVRTGKPFPLSEDIEFPWLRPLGTLSAAGGEIRLTSLASAGEAEIGGDTSEIGDTPLGKITLSDKSLLDVSGNRAGSIFIRGGQFVTETSDIYARTFGDEDGGTIDIRADTISFAGGSEINANTYGAGKGADVWLKASESVSFSGSDPDNYASKIFMETYDRTEDAGNAGSLDISANEILFSDGAGIISGTFGNGDCGDIRLRAEADICFGGVSYDPYTNYFFRFYIGDNPVDPEAVVGGIVSNVHLFSNGGSGGDIEIQAEDILLSDSACIYSTTTGFGNSGNIRIDADGSLMIKDPIGPGNWGTGIVAQTVSPGDGFSTGDGGDIFLKAESETDVP